MTNPPHGTRISAGSEDHRADGDIFHAHAALGCRKASARDIAGGTVAAIATVIGKHVKSWMRCHYVSVRWSC
jgi:hypothetical protein